MESEQLTRGAISNLLKGEKPKSVVLQVLTMVRFRWGTAFGYNSGPGGFQHLCVSDGESFSNFAILSTQYNYMVESGEIGKNSIIKINKYSCYDVKDELLGGEKKVLLISDMTVIPSGADVGQRVGNPMPLYVKKWIDYDSCEELDISNIT